MALYPPLIMFTIGRVDRSIGRYSGRDSDDSRSTVSRESVERGIDYRPSISRYFDDAPRPTIGHMSVIYGSNVGGMSVNCRSNISRVLI